MVKFDAAQTYNSTNYAITLKVDNEAAKNLMLRGTTRTPQYI